MNKYIVATLKSWNVKTYHEIISRYPGEWHLITTPENLTVELVNSISPRFIFFPHWSYRVENEILNLSECVCFHATDVPFGRGGSPMQNLIAMGYASTMVSALHMTNEMDAGPVYLKKPLSLLGLAEEIFIRSSNIVAAMILEIISNEPKPIPQSGLPVFFKRRTPDLSLLPQEPHSLSELFDHIRMLDAETYQQAFILHGNLKIEFSRPALRTNSIISDSILTLEKL